jgi:hypothetical protein
MLNLILLNAANILYIFCYGVRDVLWLRILAVAAMLLLLPYYALQIVPMTECMIWQGVFIAINVYWIIVIIRERRPPQLSDDELRLFVDVFQGCCSARDMQRLVAAASWETAADGAVLIKHNTDPKKLFIIRKGRASVQVNGEHIAFCGKDNIVGDMSFLTHEKTVADVIADGPVEYLSWPRDVLERMFESKAELKSAIHEVIGRDLIKKLISHRVTVQPVKTATVV